jgi:hypothetical protein
MTETTNDLIVVVPGILGSVLERDGKEFWNHSLAAMRRGLPPRRAARALSLHTPGTVRATGLISGLHVLPGLWGIDGYRSLLARLGRIGEVLPFPYDWRLSNAVNAGKLKDAVEARLCPGQKAAYVCHSMGGLLTRYYLEVLGGRDTARRLITLGTPHKAAAALTLGLASGARSRLGLAGLVLDDLHSVMSDFPSVYELLPTYRCVDLGGGRMASLADAPLPGIGGPLARDGAAFHRRIAEAVARNEPANYPTHLFGGHRHQTILSLRHDAAGTQALSTWDGDDPRGDGTVPRFASVTPESQDDTAVRFSGERHSALARASHVGDAVHALLTAQPVPRYQAAELELSLDLPELVAAGDALPIAVTTESDRLALAPTAVPDDDSETVKGPVLRNLGNGHYGGDLILPRPGAWRVTVASISPSPAAPVSEIIIVATPFEMVAY